MYPFLYSQAPTPSLDLHWSLSLWRKYGCEEAGFLTNAIQLTTGDHSVQGFIYGFYNRFLLLMKTFVTESVPIVPHS